MNSSKVSNQMNTIQIGSKANQINSKTENFSILCLFQHIVHDLKKVLWKIHFIEKLFHI